MDYEAVGNSALLRGAVCVGIGAVLVSAGWFLLGIYQQANNWLRKRRCFKSAILRGGPILLAWVILVFGGSILIAKGGTLTTKGWNYLDTHSQRDALIVSLIREWKVNNALLPKCHFNDTDEKTLGQRWQYPRFEWGTFSALYVSALFNSNDSRDFELLKLVLVNEIAIRELQELLDVIDGVLLAPLTANKPLQEHQGVNRSPKVKEFQTVHASLGNLLKEEYPDNWQKALRMSNE